MMNRIELEGVDKRLQKIEEIKNLNLPIFVWGGGHTGGGIISYLHENGIDKTVQCVVDDEYKKKDDGCMALSEYLQKYASESVMIFGFYNYKIIQKKKEQYGEQIKYLYDFHLTVFNEKRLKWDKEEIEGQLPKYEKTYNMLCDDKSRETMWRYLRAAVNGEFDDLYQKCHEDRAYFNDITAKTAVEILIDCGAYDGDSIHDFVNTFKQYKKIYAIEPDMYNRVKLNERILNENIRDVAVISKGVYKETTTLHFNSEGTSSSHVDETGSLSVPVIALDDLLKNCDKKMLIKMDIEGSEMDALKGAARIIASKTPCLTICVYHKEEDLITIPQFIDSLVDPETYDYYIRFHGLDLAELVFYAVPRK